MDWTYFMKIKRAASIFINNKLEYVCVCVCVLRYFTVVCMTITMSICALVAALAYPSFSPALLIGCYWIISYGYSTTIFMHISSSEYIHNNNIGEQWEPNKIVALFTQCHRKLVKLCAQWPRTWKRRRRRRVKNDLNMCLCVVYVGICVNFKAYRAVPSHIALRQILHYESSQITQSRLFYMKC